MEYCGYSFILQNGLWIPENLLDKFKAISPFGSDPFHYFNLKKKYILDNVPGSYFSVGCIPPDTVFHGVSDDLFEATEAVENLLDTLGIDIED